MGLGLRRAPIVCVQLPELPRPAAEWPRLRRVVCARLLLLCGLQFRVGVTPRFVALKAWHFQDWLLSVLLLLRPVATALAGKCCLVQQWAYLRLRGLPPSRVGT